MSSLIYLGLEGKQQGLISQGCGSRESIGLNWQLGHEDHIFVYAVEHQMQREQNLIHQPFCIIKPIDKSSPLIAQAANDNEILEGNLLFLRTAETGGLEQYFTIRLGNATICDIQQEFPHSANDNHMVPIEKVFFRYSNITWQHIAAATSSYSFWEERVF